MEGAKNCRVRGFSRFIINSLRITHKHTTNHRFNARFCRTGDASISNVYQGVRDVNKGFNIQLLARLATSYFNITRLLVRKISTDGTNFFSESSDSAPFHVLSLEFLRKATVDNLFLLRTLNPPFSIVIFLRIIFDMTSIVISVGVQELS